MMMQTTNRNKANSRATRPDVKVIALDRDDHRHPANQSNSRVLRIIVTLIAFAAAVAICTSALAQNTAVNDAPDAPPPLTAADLERSLNTDNPQSTASKTSRTTEGVVTEYRDGNRTYLIQVNPQTGARYYVNDADGNGSPESYRDNTESDVNIGKWKITSW